MQKKIKFKRFEKTERSIKEIVEEDGVIGVSDILYITEKLCLLLNKPTNNEAEKNTTIYPDNIMVNVYGDIRIVQKVKEPSILEPYIPPELPHFKSEDSKAEVYSIGILMLYMMTGKEKKKEMNIGLISPDVIPLIESCTAFDPNERFNDTAQLLAVIQSKTGFRIESITSFPGIFLICLAVAFTSFFGWIGTKQGADYGKSTGYRSGFLKGFDQGYLDAPGIGLNPVSAERNNGNLSGNFIVEDGPIAVYDGEYVYFLTAESLCRMDPYTREIDYIEKLSNAYGLQCLDGSLYYCLDGKIYQKNAKTEKAKIVCESGGMQFYIFENEFYLYDEYGTGYLYRLEVGKGLLKQLNGTVSYKCLNIVDGQLYYISPEWDNCLCRSDLDGGNNTIISSGKYRSMCIYDGQIFAVDEDGIVCMDFKGGNNKRIVNGEINDPNVCNGGIYYISENGSLEWMSIDGKYRYTIVNTKTRCFNVAGQWIIYKNEEDNDSLWRVHIGGSYNARI